MLKAEADYDNIGLCGMRERTNIAGGLFEIHSAPGEGTVIESRLPIQSRPQRRKNGSNRLDCR